MYSDLLIKGLSLIKIVQQNFVPNSTLCILRSSRGCSSSRWGKGGSRAGAGRTPSWSQSWRAGWGSPPWGPWTGSGPDPSPGRASWGLLISWSVDKCLCWRSFAAKLTFGGFSPLCRQNYWNKNTQLTQTSFPQSSFTIHAPLFYNNVDCCRCVIWVLYTGNC